MQIASRLGGFSLGQADILRRAMGKKKPEEMAKQKVLFVTGAIGKGIPRVVAERIFEQMAYFAGYGFNKSHSAAYALISYQTAWLKAHYPVPFMAAALTSEMEKTNRIVVLVEECRKMGIPVLPPDVNASTIEFRVEGKAIRFGLGAVKNVGEGAIEAILAARDGRLPGVEGGAFGSLFDFCRRVDLKAINRRMVESLVAAGAFDGLPGHRAQKMAAVGAAMEAGQAAQVERERGQFNLFGAAASGAGPAPPVLEPALPAVAEWERATLLKEEKAVLGFYLTDHPLASLREEIAAVATVDSQGLAERRDNEEVAFVGIVAAVKRTTARSGGVMAWVTLEDFAGSVECLCFPDLYEACKEVLVADRVVLVRGRTSTREDEEAVKLVAAEVSDFEESRSAVQHTLHLAVSRDRGDDSTLLRIRDILSRYPGRGSVLLHVETPEGLVPVKAGRLRVAVSGELLSELRGLLGAERVRLAEARRQPGGQAGGRGGGGPRWRDRKGSRPAELTPGARAYRKEAR